MNNESLESKLEKRQAFAAMLSKSRYTAGKSQEFMAAELGVSRKTIQNWENGISFPDAFVLGEWFEILGLNPLPYYNSYFNYDVFKDLTPSSSDEKISNALNVVVNDLSPHFKRQLLFWLHATHGSDPMSVLQLVVAHLHLPMRSRVSTARSVVEDYEICAHQGELVETDHVFPDLELLHKAIELGRDAALNNHNGYSNK